MITESEIVDDKNINKENNSKKVLAWILMAIAVIYGLSPVDIVPDIPVVGWIDDCIVNLVAFTNLIQQQFFQTNIILNKLFNTIKWINIGLVAIILMVFLIITLIIQNK